MRDVSSRDWRLRSATSAPVPPNFWMRSFAGPNIRARAAACDTASVHTLRSAGVTSMRGSSRTSTFCSSVRPPATMRTT